jgi:penicillin G amidase
MHALLRFLRRLVAAAVTVLLLAVAAVAGAIWLSLPGGDLTAAIPGLAGPVRVTLDDDGIPRVMAQNELDAAAALGFLHARERLFEMELMRRSASGELAELFGKAALPMDRWTRTLGLRERAVADMPLLPAATRNLLDAYARGVNAWIAARGRFAAPEFVPLGRPRAWTAVDSLLWGKTMALWLSDNLRAERARLVLDAKLPQQAVDALWPPAGGAGHPEAALHSDPVLAGKASRLAAAIPAFPAAFTLPHMASNAWAVDGRHTASGLPLLAGDPHLAFGFPGIWYLARLEWPGHVLAGATAPGVPMLVIGHNGRIAWTFTTTGADTQDLFVETPAGDGQYATPDGPRPYTLREERIRVRGGEEERLLVRETRHGPVIGDLAGRGGPVIALASAALAPGDTAAEGLYELNHATDLASAGTAAGAITSPVQNLLVADDSRIGLFVTGRVPIRAAGDGARAVPGADGAHDWTGFASGAQLPHYVAPESGRLVNANERVAPPDFPIFLGRDWFADWRAQRIRALLDATEHHTPADFAAMQVDAVDLAARDLLPKLRDVPAPEAPAKTALALLSGWDGTMSRNAPQPLIFNAWMMRFYAEMLTRYGVPKEADAAAAPWYQLVPAALAPGGEALCGGDCRTLLADSLAAASIDLARRFGPDPTTWRWEQAHQAVFAHPLLRLVPLLGPALEGRIGVAGDDATLARGGLAPDTLEAVHGPEFRGVYDLADLEASRFVVAPGQSGNPFSRLARNFLPRWRDGETVTLAAEVGSVAARLTLLPGPPGGGT